jgi:hypothetical protein
MIFSVSIPAALERDLRRHLFQGELEQGAFLFAAVVEKPSAVNLSAVDAYMVPPEEWEMQSEVHLEMADLARAKIMKMARNRDLAVIDCHSHPHSGNHVWFSPSDRAGITEFAGYVKWKIGGKPYTAMVLGESSLDAVAWYDDFSMPGRVDSVEVLTTPPTLWKPRGSWFKPRSSFERGRYGR